MKKIKRSLFFNLFLASIVIMNIMGVYSQVKKPAEEPPAYEDEKKDTVSAGNEADKPQDVTAENGTEASTESSDLVYSKPPEEVPQEKQFVTKDASYFDDAAFIGDSRVVGIKLYAGIQNAAFYCKEGLTVYNMFDEPLEVSATTKETLENALSQNQYKKIYLEIGINEIGIGTIDSFMEEYRHAVEHIRELQPDAAIFLCGIMHVKKEKSESDPIFSNENISQRNERISELADNKSIFYVDINELVVDKDGNLLPEYTYDEVHLLGKYYSLLSDCLLEHAVEWT